MSFLSDAIKYRRTEVAWQKKCEATAPKIGEPATDFELLDTEGIGKIKLSEFRGEKAVGLIFGSFT